MALTKVHNRMFEGAFFNVKDFGATGDGVTDDGPAIQSVIDSVPASGGTIYFPPGTYRLENLDSTYTRAYLVINSDNITLCGSAATIKVTTGSGTRRNMIYIIDASRITIEDLTFDNDDQTAVRNQPIAMQNSSHITIRNCIIEKKCGPTFVYKDCKNILITGCRFLDSMLGCIGTGGTDVSGTDIGTSPISHLVIKDNYFDGAVGEAVDINNDTFNFLIDGNFITNVSSGGLNECIDIGGPNVCQHGVICNNFMEVTLDDRNGITIKQTATDIKIENNKIVDSSTGSTDSRGIRIDDTGGARAVHILNNQISSFTRGITSGSSASNISILISGNRIISCTAQGIGGQGGDISIQDNIIDLAAVTGGSRGISCTGSERINIANNLIRGNSTLTNTVYVSNADAGSISGNTIIGGDAAFFIQLSNGVSITSNSISDAQGQGVEIKDSENIVFASNTVFDNDKGGAGLSYGVLFDTVENGIASNNAIYDTRTGGSRTEPGAIFANATSDYISFTGNVVSNTLNNTVSVNGSVTNNVVADNLV